MLRKTLEIKNRGMTIIEILLVCLIMGIISTVVIASFSIFKNSKLLDEEANKIVTLFSEAYTNTVSGVGGLNYGIHVDPDKVILFTGNIYDVDETTNKVLVLDNTVTVNPINLTGGTFDVVYSRLTGEASVEGTLTVRLTSDASKQKVITVKKLGAASRN